MYEKPLHSTQEYSGYFLHQINISKPINYQNDMSTLNELIKESLEGKLTDQIRASLEAEDGADNSDDNKSGESKTE